MNDANKDINVSAEWLKSQKAFQEAQVLLAQKLEEGAISRSYYAVFHAVKALLFSKGLDTSTHQGSMRLFNLHFIQAGLFEQRFSRVLSRAKQEREEADYFAEYTFSFEDAEENIKNAKVFLLESEKYLKSLGYLG